jgi:ABC-2 type transport system permease protein
MNMIRNSLAQPGLRSHLWALYAIARKDWKQYWRYPLNALSSVFQPLIWLAPVYYMGMAFSVDGEALGFAAYSGTSDYMSFILLGTVIGSFTSAVFWGMGSFGAWAIRSRMTWMPVCWNQTGFHRCRA